MLMIFVLPTLWQTFILIELMHTHPHTHTTRNRSKVRIRIGDKNLTKKRKKIIARLWARANTKTELGSDPEEVANQET